MSLKLMYITNNPDVALIAEKYGVDRIFIDMEYIGKDERQQGLDTVKSHHTIDDIKSVKKIISKSEIVVRVNPIHDSTRYYDDSSSEINQAIEAGADVIMLPMYRTIEEVDFFLRIVDGRAKTQLLTETIEACSIMNEVIKIPEIDEIHIGLNDLHIAYNKKFMFELLADGTVDCICDKIKLSNKKFGFGGIARIGYGILPAEYIIKEHYRIGSSCAILSRTFCNVDKIKDLQLIDSLFKKEVRRIRGTELIASKMSLDEFNKNHSDVKMIVEKIVAGM